ncbi:MAG: HAD family hydrolase [Vicinamibacterales bacterium]
MTHPDGPSPRPLHAIIFDFDGVIADSERLHLRAYQDVLAEDGITFTPEEYYARYLGYDDAGMFRTLARDRALEMNEERLAELIARKANRYEDLTASGEMLFPGAARFIREAANAVPVAIASGALTYEIEEVLDRAGLRDLFPVVVGADQTERSKPDPEPYRFAFEKLRAATGRDLDASRTVAIEDSRWGLDSARGAGLRTVAVTNTYTADELADAAELVVSGLEMVTLGALDALCEG